LRKQPDEKIRQLFGEGAGMTDIPGLGRKIQHIGRVMTMVTPVDPSEGDWSQATEIVRRVVGIMWPTRLG
jgi:hypothetical protein